MHAAPAGAGGVIALKPFNAIEHYADLIWRQGWHSGDKSVSAIDGDHGVGIMRHSVSPRPLGVVWLRYAGPGNRSETVAVDRPNGQDLSCFHGTVYRMSQRDPGVEAAARTDSFVKAASQPARGSGCCSGWPIPDSGVLKNIFHLFIFCMNFPKLSL